MSFTYNCSRDFYISRCNETNNFTFINFTFKDKTLDTYINGTINKANFSIYPEGYSSLKKIYSFSSTNNFSNYSMCIFPSNYSYYLNYNLTYYGGGYGTREFTTNNYTFFANTTTEKILYLINSTNLVTFQVINSLNQQLSGVYMYAIEYLDENNTIISSGYTDTGGILQLYINNGTQYKLYFEKAGYDSYSTILDPTDTFYTITLSGTGVTLPVPDDYSSGDITITDSKGVTFSTYPRDAYLENNTNYNFTFTVDSGTWTFDEWGFNLTDENGTLLNSTSSTNSSNGSLTLIQNTNNYTHIFMYYYYTIDGNKTTLKRYWLVLDLSDSTYSIDNAIDDATSYIDSGLFGITATGLSFIVFFIIFIGAGVLSYKFGLTSPVAICGFAFALVWFFDVSLQWIPRPFIDAPISTILVGFVLLGFIVREVAQ